MEHKYTVLIVDDVSINIDILAGILMDQYAIMEADGGDAALHILKYKKPDIVLLDLFMPGIDGFGVLRHIKADPELCNIPVIFITGEHDPGAEEKGLAMGAMDYIKKPYSNTVVKFKVRNQLELKAYRDNLESLVSERTSELQERSLQLSASHEAIIMGMSLVSESHDSVTGSHIMRIKLFADILSHALADSYPDLISPALAVETVLYSPLHDVGKVSISDSILKKTGGLTKEEFEEMKNHTVCGADLLKRTEAFLVGNQTHSDLQTAIDIALSHHERFCGGGYPQGLVGEDIPISARIVSVADVYDALRSVRPYKKGFSHTEAVEIILSGDGRTEPNHFDPRVLEMFRQHHLRFEEVYNNSL